MTTLITPRSQPSHPKASLRPIVSVVLRSSSDLQSDQGTRLAQATAIINKLVARLVVSSSFPADQSSEKPEEVAHASLYVMFVASKLTFHRKYGRSSIRLLVLLGDFKPL